MKVAICDDEKLIVEKISSCITAVSSRYGIDVECFAFTNGYELIDFCESNEPDAIFLDIAMPEIDGFQTANKLLEFKDDVALVFVSNNEALVFSSYEYKPFWFVPKSQMHLLELVVDKIMSKINNARLCSEKFNITIGKTKTIYDCCSCLLGVVLSLVFFGSFVGVYWGTIVCAILNGWLIGRISLLLENKFNFKELHSTMKSQSLK